MGMILFRRILKNIFMIDHQRSIEKRGTAIEKRKNNRIITTPVLMRSFLVFLGIDLTSRMRNGSYRGAA